MKPIKIDLNTTAVTKTEAKAKSGKFWTRIDGVTVPIEVMGDNHIKNCIKMMIRQAHEQHSETIRAGEWFEEFGDEDFSESLVDLKGATPVYHPIIDNLYQELKNRGIDFKVTEDML